MRPFHVALTSALAGALAVWVFSLAPTDTEPALRRAPELTQAHRVDTPTDAPRSTSPSPPGSLITAVTVAEQGEAAVTDDRAFYDLLEELSEVERVTPEVDQLLDHADAELEAMNLNYGVESQRAQYLGYRSSMAQVQASLSRKLAADLEQFGGEVWPAYPGQVGADAPPSRWLARAAR